MIVDCYDDLYDVVAESYDCNSYYEKYRKNRKLTPTEMELLDRFIAKVKSINGAVIDVGCGDGSLFDTYIHGNGCELIGVDISQKQIDTAKKNLPDCQFYKENYLKTNFEYMLSVSGIICMYALYNFFECDVYIALQKMYNTLRDGGVILVNVRLEYLKEIKKMEDWCGQPMLWSMHGLEFILDTCNIIGFSRVEVINNPDNPDYSFVWLEK